MDHSFKIEESLIPTDSSFSYFPLGGSMRFVTDSLNLQADSFVKLMHSETLFWMKESPLYNVTTKDNVFRMLWLRNYDNPVVIRINIQQENMAVTIKELKKEFHNEDIFTYKIAKDTSWFMSSDRFKSFILESENQTGLKSHDSTLDTAPMHFTSYIFEANRQGKYFCTFRLFDGPGSLENIPAAAAMYEIANNVIPLKISR